MATNTEGYNTFAITVVTCQQMLKFFVTIQHHNIRQQSNEWYCQRQKAHLFHSFEFIIYLSVNTRFQSCQRFSPNDFEARNHRELLATCDHNTANHNHNRANLNHSNAGIAENDDRSYYFMQSGDNF